MNIVHSCRVLSAMIGLVASLACCESASTGQDAALGDKGLRMACVCRARTGVPIPLCSEPCTELGRPIDGQLFRAEALCEICADQAFVELEASSEREVCRCSGCQSASTNYVYPGYEEVTFVGCREACALCGECCSLRE